MSEGELFDGCVERQDDKAEELATAEANADAGPLLETDASASAGAVTHTQDQ